ncbi:MAG: 5-oxoprolinase subunit PxpA [Actinomycetia bacterium]|nr:5-oxoprolinase subunit PxpA [Actinomycetes bacterium]MCH9801914.1 5-oxoprolinase subunit PxpA [Actinomycetes bacterium]
MTTIDLNADLGELPGAAGEQIDADLLNIVSSANVAAGGHAGDAASMVRVCRTAAAHAVAMGAHLSYPDRENFGRLDMEITADDLAAALTDQLNDLTVAARQADTQVRYVKLHGALYNRAAADPITAQIVADALEGYRLPVLTLPDSQLVTAADRVGLHSYAEAFVDRSYTDDATLQPRRFPDALITSPADVARRALALARRTPIETVTGGQLRISADSLCLHSDSPDAVTLAGQVRKALLAANVTVAAFADTQSATIPRYRQVGADAILLLLPDPEQRRQLAALVSVTIPGIREVVPAATTMLVRFDPRQLSAATAARAVGLAAGTTAQPVPRQHVIPVRYNGPDLAAVATTVGISTEALIDRHTQPNYIADFTGFSPGFAYLSGSDPALHLPRLATPRTQVPAGSVAIADRYTAIYPTSSPGGWHLLGSTDAVMFDPERADPATIRAGDLVRFEPVT